MNQTRIFLIFAWLMVAVLLWMEWGREKAAPPVTQTTTAVAAANQTVPGATPGGVPGAQVPGADAAATTAQATATPATQRVTVTTDVLRLVLDGGRVLDAELLQFPQTKADNSPPVRLLTEDAAHPYSAISGWASEDKSVPVPGADGFIFGPPFAITSSYTRRFRFSLCILS